MPFPSAAKLFSPWLPPSPKPFHSRSGAPDAARQSGLRRGALGVFVRSHWGCFWRFSCSCRWPWFSPKRSARASEAYLAAFTNPDARAAIRLTLLTAAISVPANIAFGVGVAAWAIPTKFRFRGKSVLITLIDLPFAVSPVVAGLIYILLYGRNGWFGGWLAAHNISGSFLPVPGIILVTTFVCFPSWRGELIPPDAQKRQGTDEELPPPSPWGRTAGRSSGGSPCPTSAGGCSMAPSSATPAPWANSARSPW